MRFNRAMGFGVGGSYITGAEECPSSFSFCESFDAVPVGFDWMGSTEGVSAWGESDSFEGVGEAVEGLPGGLGNDTCGPIKKT